MRCSICNAWPIVNFTSPIAWYQDSNPIPSNRICIHLFHFLTCPNCNFTTETAKEQAQRYEMPDAYRQFILKRDNYTCQACGYHPAAGRQHHYKRTKLTGANKLYELFTKTLKRSTSSRQLHVAHYHARYGSVETQDNRTDPKLARTLCAQCHTFESALHETERWQERRAQCPILQKLE